MREPFLSWQDKVLEPSEKLKHQCTYFWEKRNSQFRLGTYLKLEWHLGRQEFLLTEGVQAKVGCGETRFWIHGWNTRFETLIQIIHSRSARGGRAGAGNHRFMQLLLSWLALPRPSPLWGKEGAAGPLHESRLHHPLMQIEFEKGFPRACQRL